MSTDCPAANVQALRLRTTFKIAETIETFTAAKQTRFKTKLAAFLAPAASDLEGTLSHEDIELVISAGSINVEALIDVPTPSLSATFKSSITALTPAAASTALEVTVNEISAPKVEDVVFTPPMPPPPPHFPVGEAPPPVPPGLDPEAYERLSQLAIGVIIAIIIGSIVCLCAIIAAIVACICCCCQKKKAPNAPGAGAAPGGVVLTAPEGKV